MLMKRLFYLIALLVVAFACQATPTIPTVGATLPIGDKSEEVSGTFNLCKRTYKAMRINDNGTLSNIEVYNYLEVDTEGDYPNEISFHGLMGGINPTWITPYNSDQLYFDRRFGVGAQVGKLPDGTPVGIYPVEHVQNIDGDYSLKILREDGSIHHPDVGVNITYYGGKLPPSRSGLSLFILHGNLGELRFFCGTAKRRSHICRQLYVL